jgi:putative N6-adenine-specific DNA methylase
VLMRVAHAGYLNENDIYDLALAQSWEDWFGVDHTIRIDVTAIKSPLKSLEFTTLKIKDAICDRFRDLCGKRPSVDTREPDMRVFAFIDTRNVTLYLDTSGEALFKRGWRLDTGDAPLRENLAAGLLRVSGWKPGDVLFDPCAARAPSWRKPRKCWPVSRPARAAASRSRSSTRSAATNGAR